MVSKEIFLVLLLPYVGLMGGQNNANKRDFPPVRRKKHIIQSFQLSYWYRIIQRLKIIEIMENTLIHCF